MWAGVRRTGPMTLTLILAEGGLQACCPGAESTESPDEAAETTEGACARARGLLRHTGARATGAGLTPPALPAVPTLPQWPPPERPEPGPGAAGLSVHLGLRWRWSKQGLCALGHPSRSPRGACCPGSSWEDGEWGRLPRSWRAPRGRHEPGSRSWGGGVSGAGLGWHLRAGAHHHPLRHRESSPFLALT